MTFGRGDEVLVWDGSRVGRVRSTRGGGAGRVLVELLDEGEPPAGYAAWFRIEELREWFSAPAGAEASHLEDRRQLGLPIVEGVGDADRDAADPRDPAVCSGAHTEVSSESPAASTGGRSDGEEASPSAESRQLEVSGTRGPRRLCAWCRVELEATKRSDARTCSKSCRQALHRFRVAPAAGATDDRPIRVAYADPPYPGLAGRYYGKPEVEHDVLVDRLVREFPDGWALSTSSEALPIVLPLCPADVRVCIWVNGSLRVRSRGARKAYEAVIIAGGRPPMLEGADLLDDVLLCARSARQRSHPGALVGMKPAAFCEWMFRVLGLAQGDELVDLFPGSGAVTRAWELYTSRAPANGTLPSRFEEAATRLGEVAGA